MCVDIIQIYVQLLATKMAGETLKMTLKVKKKISIDKYKISMNIN